MTRRQRRTIGIARDRCRRMTVESLEGRQLLAGDIVMFNDHVAGPGTHVNATRYAGNATASGFLKDIATGANTSITLTASNSGAAYENTSGVPAAGTPAHTVFNSFVDFSSGTGSSLAVSGATTYTLTLSGMSAANRYDLAGTAVRGNAGYTDRWTLVELVGTASFTVAHSSGLGIVTTGLAANQVALWTGENHSTNQGFIAQWTDIDPGPDGQVQIVSSQYRGATPGVGSGNASSGSKGYAIAGIRLIEHSVAFGVVTSSPANNAVLAAVPTSATFDFSGAIDAGSIAAADLLIDGAPATAVTIVDADTLRFDLPALVPGGHTLAIAAGAIFGGGLPNAQFISTFTVLAPPTVQNTAAANITAESARLGGQVTATGGENPAVTVYWDTSDRGPVAAAWNNSLSLGTGGVGTYEQTIDTLAPATTYFYRTRAVNAAGESWASSTASFTTLAALFPAVSNSPATNVGATSATLRGIVTSTGNQVPAVTIFYGDDDAGDGTSTPWDHSVSVGPQSGSFASVITGLSPLTTYYFRARATNSAGSVWGTPSLSFTTPEQPPATIVINEIHYDPDVKTESVEFIELYNHGQLPIDLSGWYFSAGIDYTFPANTIVPAGSYIVVAENPTALAAKYGVAALGPWTGGLQANGETITLRDAGGVVQDEVDFQLGFPWPTVGNAPGHSIELVHPSLDNDLGGSWRSSRGSAASGGTLFASSGNWKYVKGLAGPSTTTGAWRQTSFSDATWSDGTGPVGYGDPFVVTNLADMRGSYSSVYLRKSFNVNNPQDVPGLRFETQFDDGINVWINGTHVLGNNVSGVELPYNATATSSTEDASFRTFNLPAPAGYLVPGTNVIAVQLLNASLGGSSDAWFDARLVQGSAGAGPTPGRVNSVYSANAAPQLRQVNHSPEQPAAGEPVTITVKATDPDGVASVQLEYQLVDPGDYIELADPRYATQWTPLTMRDNGLAGDATAEDDVFSVVIPAALQTHRRLVRYRVTATDAVGRSIRAPYDDDSVPNFAYFVYNGVPAYQGAIQPGSADPTRSQVVTYDSAALTSVPVYHLLTTRSDHVEAQHIPNATSGAYGGDSYLWQGTLVYDGKVYDHVEYRARGGVWRYAMGKNMWKFDFRRGHDFEARDNYGNKYDTPWTKLNLGANIQQGDFQQRGEQGLFESVGFRLFNLAGSPTSKTNYVHFRIIDRADESGPTQYDGDFQGLYLAVEQLDGRFLDEHDLPDGNLYKMEGGTGEANNIGPAGPTDKSDLNSFIAAYSAATPPTDQWWRDNFDLDQYYAYRAMVEAVHHWDIGFGKNYFYYRNPETGQWSEHAWDLDLTWTTTYEPGCGDCEPFKTRVLSRPAFLMEYRNRLREIRDLLFNSEQVGMLIDEQAAFVDTPANGPSLIDADRAQWDYNPLMVSSYVNSSKAGHGRYYQSASPQTFAGMVQKIKNYVATRSAYLDTNVITAADDAAAPPRRTVTYTGTAGFPANRLTFSTNAFAAGNAGGGFAAMEWRVAEVTDPSAPAYDPAAPKLYEINPAWESGELTTFAAGVTIRGDVVEPGHAYRIRVRMKDTNGRWGHWSNAVQFTASPPLTTLRISEIMYHPAAQTPEELAAAGVPYDQEEFEFIELVNTDASPVNLTGVRFTNGIELTLGSHTLAPGEHAAVVRNSAAFHSRYGVNVRLIGVYGGTIEDYRLANGGERLVLQEAGGAVIHDFSYNDQSPWPAAPDGQGASLVIRNLTANVGTWSDAATWRESYDVGGSPGRADLLLGDFNQDGRADAIDLSYLQSRLGAASGATTLSGDLTGDGAVGRGDAARFVRNLGRSVAGAPSLAPPQAVVARAVDQALSEFTTTRSRSLSASGRRPRAATTNTIDSVDGPFDLTPFVIRAVRKVR